MSRRYYQVEVRTDVIDKTAHIYRIHYVHEDGIFKLSRRLEIAIEFSRQIDSESKLLGRLTARATGETQASRLRP